MLFLILIEHTENLYVKIPRRRI